MDQYLCLKCLKPLSFILNESPSVINCHITVSRNVCSCHVILNVIATVACCRLVTTRVTRNSYHLVFTVVPLTMLFILRLLLPQ